MADPSDTDFTAIHNPYIVGNPIKDSKMFFGRQEDFAYIKKALSGSAQGGLVVLCGARRSGKTSILFQILEGRLGENFMPVLIDMQSMAITSDADFLTKLARSIVGGGIIPTFSSIEHFLVDKSDSPYDAFEHLIKRVTQKLEGKKLVLTFDEYELIETNIDSGTISERILQLLASIIEHHDVFAVFTGSDHLEERNRSYWNIFLSKARQKRISFLHIRDTLRLITKPLEGEIEFDEQVPEQIAALTAGQPFYTQVLCRSLIDRLNDERKRRVSSDDVNHVVDEVVENPLPQMIFHWNALPQIEKLALSIIAELNKTEQRPIGAKDICDFAKSEEIGYTFDTVALNKSLEHLFHDDLIVKELDSDAYTFKMGLWRRWVMRMHSVWQVVDEIEKGGELPHDSGLIPPRRKTWRWQLAALGVIVVALVAAVGYQIIGQRQSTSSNVPTVAAVDSATIAVNTAPPNAMVFVDGHPTGLSPLTQRVAADTHSVEVALTNYARQERTVFVASEDSQTVEFQLEPLTGSLRITSSPDGAEIYINGARTGRTTPAEIPGLSVVEPHEVVVRLASHRPGTFRGVYVTEDGVKELNHDFARQTAVATMSSAPPGALVVLDGESLGPTPLSEPRIPYGTHEVRLRLEGYADTTVTISVGAPTIRVDVTLRKLPAGFVFVQILGAGDIEVDGRVVAQRVEHRRLRLEPGRHEIKVTHVSGKAETRTVIVEPTETKTERFEFK